MFETLPSPSLDVVLIVLRGLLLIGAVCVFALAFIRWRRADEQNNLRMQQQLERAFGELRSLHETVIVMSARIESMSERSDVGSRLAPASVTAPQRGYDMATRLAKNGAGAEELVTNCGITRHEAELLVRLHGARGGEVATTRLKQQAQSAQRPAPRNGELRIENGELPQAAQPGPAVQGRKRGSLLSVVG